MRPLVALALLLSSFSAQAAMDITRQHVAVDLTASATGLDVTATLEVTLDAPTSSLVFLAPTLAVDAATLDGNAVAASVSGYVLRVTPAAQLAAGPHTLTLHFAGVPQCVTGGRRECLRTAAFTFLPQVGELMRWYLLGVTESDPFVGAVSVRTAPGHRVAMVQGGLGVKTSNADGSQTWTFDYATPTEQLGLVAGSLSSIDSADGFVTGLFADPASAPVMQRLVADAARYYPVYADLYGPLPLAHFNITFVPQDFMAGAMGQFGLVFTNDFITNPNWSYITPQFPHEVAHSWWGNYASPEVPFLSESMAEYSLWRATGVLEGEVAAAAGRRMNAVWYLYGRGGNDDAAILDPGVTASPVYVHVTYHKASVAVRTLEEWVGKDAFTRGLRAAVQNHRNLTVDDWFAELQAQTPLDLRPLRAAWFETPGFPRLAVASALTPDGAGHKVQLRVSMAGNFPIKAPLRLSFSDGTQQMRHVLLGPGTNDWTETFPQAPVSIALDPEWTAVREVRPEVAGDVNLDGQVDGADLLETALHLGAALPPARRMDGSYDPLFDLDRDRTIGPLDVQLVQKAANP